jgi:putative serine protease PepD
MPRRPHSLWIDRPDDWPDAAPAVPQDEPTIEQRPTEPAAHPRPRRAGARRGLAFAAAAVLAGSVGAASVVALTGDDAPAARTTTTTAAALPGASGTVPATPNAKLYARASRAVVSIRVSSGSQTASGTGFVIDRDGTIVTNAHVVGDAKTVQVRIDDDRGLVSGEVAGTDASTDLAVLKVDTAAVSGITPLRLADSDAVKVGDTALAIGYPLGLDRTATSGIVSGVGREIEAPNGFSIDKVIQTDAPINPGNSGGPLLDAAGRVIGVNSQIATAGAGGGNVGIGFAVPSNTVREVVPRLLSGETIQRPYLGVSTTDPQTQGAGATVAQVVAGGPADRGGLQVGDEFVTVDGDTIDSADDVATAISDRSPGDEVTITVRRGGSEQTLRVTLCTRPDATP